MGVYIKGIEMPKHCGECGIEWCERWKKLIVAGMSIAKSRPSDCPLVPVPEHGDLIDRDALKAKQQEDADLFINAYTLMEKTRRDEALNAVANIVNAPTIIPAEPPVMHYPQVPGITPTVIAEEVYDEYTDTAGNRHWKGVLSGEHTIPADKEGE